MTSDAQPSPDRLHADVIQAQFERILGSARFRDSLRLSRFLSFVVATTLAGKTDCIRAYTIATQALGRGTDFDPQNDPIVRVEAGRLRHALARYYAGDGRDDPVSIELPRGTYVPTFSSRASAPPQRISGTDAAPADIAAKTPIQQPGQTYEFNRSVSESIALAKCQRGQIAEISGVLRSVAATLRQSRSLIDASAQILSGARPGTPDGPGIATKGGTDKPSATGTDKNIGRTPLVSRARAKRRVLQAAVAAIAVLAILETLFDIDHRFVGGTNHGLWYKLWPATSVVTSVATAGEGAPTIYVEPITTVGPEAEGLFPAKAMRQRLIGALALYDDVTVVTGRPDNAAIPRAVTPAGQLPPSNYRLAATVRYGDVAGTLIVQLIDSANDAIAWSRQYERSVKPHARLPKGSIAPDVAHSLVDPFGVIQARERVKLAAVDPMRDSYRCVLDANSYLRSFDPSQYRPVRDCLVAASERTPSSVTVFADLAFVYLRNYRFGIAAAPGDPAMLEAAYAMAARAVDIKPESAFAQYALAAVLLAKGDIARAKIASDSSYRLNPDDSAVAFGHATVLILTGEADAGLAVLDKNTVKSPNSWIGYHLVKALGSYLKNDFKTAAAESAQIANPFFPPGLMLDAVIADKAGDRARAQQDIAMLYQFYPAWRRDFRASVGRYLPEPAMVDRVAADFKAAAADTMQ